MMVKTPKWIEWNEPFFTDRPPYGNTKRRMLTEDVPGIWRRTHPDHLHLYESDELCILDFMTVNWAWFADDGNDPAEED